MHTPPTFAILSATLYFWPSFSNSAMTQSVMQGVHSAYRQSSMPFTRSICRAKARARATAESQPCEQAALTVAKDNCMQHCRAAADTLACRVQTVGVCIQGHGLVQTLNRHLLLLLLQWLLWVVC
jgi:hypothetical protein